MNLDRYVARAIAARSHLYLNRSVGVLHGIVHQIIEYSFERRWVTEDSQPFCNRYFDGTVFQLVTSCYPLDRPFNHLSDHNFPELVGGLTVRQLAGNQNIIDEFGADYDGPDVTDLNYTFELKLSRAVEWPVPSTLP